jgi:hypothetical protein
MSGGGGASFAYSDTALKFVCSVNVLGSGSTLLFGNNVLSVFQSTVGLIFSLEGYNAVRRRSITRLRRFLSWLVCNLIACLVIGYGAYNGWFDSCEQLADPASVQACTNSTRTYGNVEIVWGGACLVAAVLVGRLLAGLRNWQQNNRTPRRRQPAPAPRASKGELHLAGLHHFQGNHHPQQGQEAGQPGVDGGGGGGGGGLVGGLGGGGGGLGGGGGGGGGGGLGGGGGGGMGGGGSGASGGGGGGVPLRTGAAAALGGGGTQMPEHRVGGRGDARGGSERGGGAVVPMAGKQGGTPRHFAHQVAHGTKHDAMALI